MDTPVKLRDDLKISAEEFKIESYLEKSEAFKYIGELPGVEDIIKAIDGFLGDVVAFLGKLKDILMKLLEWLDIFGLISGLEDLLQFIFGIFNNGLFGFGFPLQTRGSVLDSLNGGCVDLNRNYGFDGLEHFGLLSLLTALGCSGMSNSYSTTYGLFMNNPKLKDKKTELTYLQSEYNTIDSQDEKDRLTQEISKVQQDINGKENAINALFATATPYMYSLMSKKPNTSLKSVIDLTNDIGTTPVAGIIGGTTTGISNVITHALNKSDGVMNGINPSGFPTFIGNITTMDSGFMNNVTKGSSVLSSLTTSFNRSTPVTSFSKPSFSPKDFLLF